MSIARRALIVTFVLKIAVFAIACSSGKQSTDAGKNQASSVTDQDYFPLSAGSKWIYAIEYVAFGVGGQKGKAASRVDGEETINGNSYYRIISVYSGIPGAESDTNYYRKTQSGVYLIEGKHKDHPEVLYLPLPLRIGQEWIVALTEMTIRYRVESKETAQLFDNAFPNSFKISYEYDKKMDQGISHIKGYKYLAPNMGVVKESDQVENHFKPSRGEGIIYPKRIAIDETLESYTK